MNEELIPRVTLNQMVQAFNRASNNIHTAYKLLTDTEAELRAVFKSNSYYFSLNRDEYRRNYESPQDTVDGIKRDVWRALVDRMELRRVMSIAKAKELADQLEKGKDLPDITLANLMAMLENTLDQIPRMMEEAVAEVFDWLRPSRSEYKTNTEFEIGERVVLKWCVESGYRQRGSFRVNYHREANLIALDNVFHMLDGKGTVKTSRGPLVDGINTTQDGTGTTEYFAFKCFLNHNLHIKFLRPDLVAKLNQLAGGNRLKPQSV